MKRVPKDRIIRYLLGDLPDRERDHLEKEYFANPAFLDEIDAAEAECYDLYARDLLPPALRSKFPGRFLNSEEGRKKLLFAESLRDHFADQPTPPVPELSWLERARELFALRSVQLVPLGAVVLLLAFFLGRLALRPAPPAPKPDAPEMLATVTVPVFETEKGENGESVVAVPSQGCLIRLTMRLDKLDFEVYTASVRALGNDKIPDMIPRIEIDKKNQQIIASFPSEKIPAGHYSLVLSGDPGNGQAQPIRTYSFRVEKKPPA